VRFKAEVKGTDAKTVKWEVNDTNGGSINAGGVYNAPDVAGTYEITVRSEADESVFAKAFVIVE